MASNVITFPRDRVTRVFTDMLPDDATPLEEAIFQVRRARHARDTTEPNMRQHHVATIILKWWEGELSRLKSEAA